MLQHLNRHFIFASATERPTSPTFLPVEGRAGRAQTRISSAIPARRFPHPPHDGALNINRNMLPASLRPPAPRFIHIPLVMRCPALHRSCLALRLTLALDGPFHHVPCHGPMQHRLVPLYRSLILPVAETQFGAG